MTSNSKLHHTWIAPPFTIPDKLLVSKQAQRSWHVSRSCHSNRLKYWYVCLLIQLFPLSELVSSEQKRMVAAAYWTRRRILQWKR